MTEETHYDVLGISPDATQDKVHRTCISLLQEFEKHADDSPERKAREARVRMAYQVLSNRDTRAFYNASLKLAAPTISERPVFLEAEEKDLEFWTNFAVHAFWVLIFG